MVRSRWSLNFVKKLTMFEVSSTGIAMENEAFRGEDLTLEQFHELLAQHEREVGLGNVVPLTLSPPPRPQPRPKRRLRPALLFLATCLSTLYIGGPAYAVAIMSILIFHEMGHYLQSVRYRVPASFPYFIPMPFPPFGTMGAVIVQQRGAGDRKALFDIAISGPLAGLVLAIPAAYFGIKWSTVGVVTNSDGLLFGEPLLFQWMIAHIHGPIAEGYLLSMHPLAHAGWVGIFITALNLVPVSQLDGGHIIYALIGKRAHAVSIGFLMLVIGYMVWTDHYQWILMVTLLLIMGPKHPPTANDHAHLGIVRKILGWLTLAFFIIGMTPNPFP